jgi:cytoskeletal protein CcmA (bactofilin family)
MTDRSGNLNELKTTISENTMIKGDFNAEEEVLYYGQFNGKMKLNSLLVVKETGKIKGKLKVENMIVEGEVNGEIEVQQKIEVRTSGRFQGKVICKQIAIEEGAFFQGDINMDDGKQLEPIIFKEKREELLKGESEEKPEQDEKPTEGQK